MIRSLFIAAFGLIFVTSCSSDSNPENVKEVDLKIAAGDWLLAKEIINNIETECSNDPIQRILSIQENGYFIIYDDLSKTGETNPKSKIHTIYNGQYELKGNHVDFTLNSEDGTILDECTVEKSTNDELVLKNIKTKNTRFYVRK